MKNAKNLWTDVTSRKTTKSEAKKLYNELIQKDIDTLEKSKSNKPEKYNILDILDNVGSIFTGVYLHYKHAPSESEESIAKRIKLRRQRSDEIANKEKMIDPESFREYFGYLSPSEMYKNLNKTINSEENKAQINAIKDKLANLIEEFRSRSKSNAKKKKKN